MYELRHKAKGALLRLRVFHTGQNRLRIGYRRLRGRAEGQTDYGVMGAI